MMMMMKKNFYVVGMAAILFLGSCQDSDENVNNPVINGESKQVKFELDASSLMQGQATRTYTPTYDINGFSIYAYKLNGSDYVFEKTVSLANMDYNPTTKKLTGTDNLPIGSYKFIHGYGLNQDNLTVPTSGTLSAGTVTYAGGPLTEVFLETDKTVDALVKYDLGINEAAATTVTGTLKRAVSRVDLMFISADKNGDGITEKKYYDYPTTDVFGGKVIDKIEMQLSAVNSQMNLFGVNIPATLPSGTTITLENEEDTNTDWNYITVGNADGTEVGKQGYLSYDEIESGHIIAGGAHVFGTYLLHNNNNTATTGLKLVITPKKEEGKDVVARTITIPNGIPLERNKVTLVKVYVLNDNNVFTTTVDFEVVIDTEWLNANEATGTIS